MLLSARNKHTIYHHLAQMVRSGITLPAALEKLAATSDGALRRPISNLRDALAQGQTAGEAFANCRAFSQMESSVIGAVEHGGRLEFGLQQLAHYFDVFAQAGASTLRRIAYPIFLLHFAAAMMPLPKLFSAGAGAYFREVFTFLGILYAVMLGVYLCLPLLRGIGTRSALADRLVRLLPLLGRVRSHFAHARFCMVYDIQLSAGVNVMAALETAAIASQSGLIRDAIPKIIPELRAGNQVGPLLARANVFPMDMIRSFMIGEDSGELDHELQRMSAEYTAKALQALQAAVTVLSMCLYLGVVLYLAWRIVATYQNLFNQFEELTNFK